MCQSGGRGPARSPCGSRLASGDAASAPGDHAPHSGGRRSAATRNTARGRLIASAPLPGSVALGPCRDAGRRPPLPARRRAAGTGPRSGSSARCTARARVTSAAAETTRRRPRAPRAGAWWSRVAVLDGDHRTRHDDDEARHRHGRHRISRVSGEGQLDLRRCPSPGEDTAVPGPVFVPARRVLEAREAAVRVPDHERRNPRGAGEDAADPTKVG